MKRDLETILQYTKENQGCLEWIRCLNTDGYPRALIDGDANAKVHRVVYELFNQEKAEGYVIRHTCDNPKCINPLHLMKGTPKQNVEDRVKRNRSYRRIYKDTVLKTKSLLETGLFSQKEIAMVLGLDPRRVSDIKRGLYSEEGKFLGRG